MKVLKIGGSALTDKKTGESYVREVAGRVARELRRDEKYVIVHGVGYIGHTLAKKYRLHLGFRDNPVEWAYLRARVNEMTRDIVLALTEQGHPAIEISVPDIIRTHNGKIIFFDLEVVNKFLEMGFIPVMHGDGAIDDVLGLVVLSGDKIATEIAVRLNADELIYGTDVDGILDENGEVIESISRKNIDTLKFWENDDFSGGMRNKVNEAINLNGTVVRIINMRKDGMLERVLNGENVGTTIEG
jgi:isopentenyl phosphate kinase